MKKSEQAVENLRVEIAQVYVAGGGYKVISVVRLRSCHATVSEIQDTENGNIYFLLHSYGTPIALIDCAICYDWLRSVTYRDFSTGYLRHGYSSTSASHISKFMREYGANKKYTWREV